MKRESSPVSDDEIFVNAQDGLSLEAMDAENLIMRKLQDFGVDICAIGRQLGELSLEDIVNDTPFPTTLIVTGFNEAFFEDEPLKRKLEEMFQAYGRDAQFHYFKSFKRVRVTFESAASAIRARGRVHISSFGNDTLKCYFGQPIFKSKSKDGLLHPPTPDKQFLISPPASPPVDWEPRPEASPNLDYDLISALAKLGPGECHQLHKPESEFHPSIVVHIAEEEAAENERNKTGLYIPGSERSEKVKIVPTKRPEN